MGRRASLLSADALWASEAQLKMRMLCQHLECQKRLYEEGSKPSERTWRSASEARRKRRLSEAHEL